jgi:hypothetical protein
VNCAPGAYGRFNGTASNLGLDEGLLLTTGTITNAIGPNDDDGLNFGTDHFRAGDPQLDVLAGPFNPTFDACVFQFDVVPYGDTIRFDFSFASEEYLEYVNAFYNDVFGFFISGPNPAGGSYANRNIALIPGTTTPVSVDNVNAFLNSQYYLDNGDGICLPPFILPPVCTNQSVLQYDGFTRNLFAMAPVVPCQTYQLKLAIADVGDGIYDSGVFI